MTTSPPDWVTAVPPASVHSLQPGSVWEEMSQEQASLLRSQFIEAILGVLVEALRGIFVPLGLGSAFDQLVEWAEQILGSDFIAELFGDELHIASDVARLLRSLFGFFPSLINLGDGTMIPNLFSTVTDLFDGTLDLAADIFTLMVHGLDGTIMGLASLLQNFTGMFGVFQGLLDGIVNALTGGLGPVGSAIEHVVTGMAGFINNLTGGLLGLFLGGSGLGGLLFGFGDVRTASNNTASSLVALSQAITALKAQLGLDETLVAEANFTTAPDATSLPAGWSTTYSGSAYRTYGTYGGFATWRGSAPYSDTSFHRYQLSQWTLNETSGNEQIVCMVFGSTARSGTYNTIVGRLNAAGTDRVEAQFKGGNVTLQCYVGGVKTVLATASHDQKSGSPYYLHLGADGTDRKFVVLDGSNVILSYTDVAAVSAMDASHRYAGMGSDYYTSTVLLIQQVVNAGSVAYWSLVEPTGGS